MVVARARLSTPEPIVALPCGSRSTSRTRWPTCASPAARFTAVVVLPTPPFWLAMQKILAMCASEVDEGHAQVGSCLAQRGVAGGQGQAAPHGEVEVGGVVGGQARFPGKVEHFTA